MPPRKDETKQQLPVILDEAGLPAYVQGKRVPGTDRASLGVNVDIKLSDRLNELFLNILTSMFDGLPLTLAQWAELFDGDLSTSRQMNIDLALMFKVPVQVSEVEFVDKFGSDIPGQFTIMTPGGDSYVWPHGTLKAHPKTKVSSITFVPDFPPVQLGDIILKTYAHVVVFQNLAFHGVLNALLFPGGVAQTPWKPALPHAEIFAVCHITDIVIPPPPPGAASGILEVLQSFDAVNIHFISRFAVSDYTVGNPPAAPVPGSGEGVSVRVIAPYVSVRVTNNGLTPYTNHLTFAHVRAIH